MKCRWKPVWQNRDPIHESGGLNLYDFISNGPSEAVDSFGLDAISGTPVNAPPVIINPNSNSEPDPLLYDQSKSPNAEIFLKFFHDPLARALLKNYTRGAGSSDDAFPQANPYYLSEDQMDECLGHPIVPFVTFHKRNNESESISNVNAHAELTQ